jgi:alpha-mannosidase
MKSQTTVMHVINHTHWDREWFAPFSITRQWIPGLIRNLAKVVERNSDYLFLLDGQTEVMDDLKQVDLSTYHAAAKLIKDHNLQIGPYYVQVEMRNPGAESLIRNLRIGTHTALDLGASNDFVAWDVDSFGHVSQSPQIHGLFGIRDAYMWRGPARLDPFFWWHGSDGTTMLAIDLFAGGYRNFYKVTSKPELALPRLEHEVQKLRPYYPTGHIPVFDGFDLDQEPGDAATYFSKDRQLLSANNVDVITSSPHDFAQTIRQIHRDYPDTSGEMISGKYSSVFPGTLSARTYSKLISAYVEQLLYRYAEPLALLLSADKYPETLFEQQSKLILQNLVHDVISGCSIDQVHDVAELRAADVTTTLKASIEQSLNYAAGSLEDGVYAYNPSVGAGESEVAINNRLYTFSGSGVCITKVTADRLLDRPDTAVESFSWQNDHYSVTVGKDGVISLGEGRFGQLITQLDNGDTYWDEPRGQAIPLAVDGPLTVSKQSDGYAELTFTAKANNQSYKALVQVTIIFDQSPAIKWRLQLETSGVGFSVSLRNSYGRPLSKLNVGMQFDNVIRNFEDTDLLGRQLDDDLSSVLIGGQRDLDQTFTFPFHSYISPTVNPDHAHLVAKGLRAYQTAHPGMIDLVLTRPVEWVMRPGFHKYHSGDAGPKFMVPGARAERTTVIEAALLIHRGGPDSIEFHQAVDQFINPPLLFAVKGSRGKNTHIPMFDEPVPISSIHQYAGRSLVRLFNPTQKYVDLHTEHKLVSEGQPSETITELAAKRIAAVALPPISVAEPSSKPSIKLLNWPKLPVGPDKSKPSPDTMTVLVDLYRKLKSEHDSLEAIIDAYGKNAPHALTHRYYVVTREYMEVNLSFKWNELRAMGVKPNNEYEYPIPKDLKHLTDQYNDMRINRRMYDYIVGIDENGERVAEPNSHLAAKR